MIRVQIDHRAKAVRPLLGRLPRKAVHEINGQVVEARCPGNVHRLHRLPEGMGPAKDL